MMDSQELEIIINKEGIVTIQVRGVKGEICKDITKDLEQSLGDLEECIYTEEFYEKNQIIDNYQQNQTKK